MAPVFLNRNISQTLITPPVQQLTREALALFIFKLVLPVIQSIQHNQREQRLQRHTVFPLGFFSLVSYIAGTLANPSHTDRITCWDTDQTLHPGFTYWSITDTHMKRTQYVHSHTHTHLYSLELRRIMALRQTYSSLWSLSSLTLDVAAISISKISTKPWTQLPSSLPYKDTRHGQLFIRKLLPIFASPN